MMTDREYLRYLEEDFSRYLHETDLGRSEKQRPLILVVVAVSAVVAFAVWLCINIWQ